VPKSRVRKRPVYTPPTAAQSRRRAVSPPWLVPTMVASLILGLVWIALYYITQSDMPGLSVLGGWNLVCGFVLIVVGVVLATRWH
jgi:Cell division protein CrgA